jgi:hypothetical protein
MLTMKNRYAAVDSGKIPESFKKEFDEIFSTQDELSLTDAEAEETFGANFNDLMELVEKKYPDALRKGGTVKKVKPAKVKKVKPKPAPEVKIPAAMRKKLSESDIIFIEDQLTNAENTSDEEMIDLFVKEVGLTEAKAKKWIALRPKYMRADVYHSMNYPTRTKLKKEMRKGIKSHTTDIIKTRDDKDLDRKSSKNIGKTFYDENGKAWKCKGYSEKLDECILEDSDGKEISSCLKDMYTTNPVKKREKGNLVDECKDTLKDAGYTVKVHKTGTKKITRSEPRPEKAIIKERVEDTFTPITKDLGNSEEKAKENKEILAVISNIQSLFTKFMNRISNLADDGKIEQLKKIEKLLSEIID